MGLQAESAEVRLPPNNHTAPNLSCAGCGKPGVSICAKCAKTGYRTEVARANPLQKRDPELYNRLDQMSRMSLEDNKKLWDEFCIEIKAGDLYEHLPILVEILHEGKWRTDALDVRKWLRGNLAKRVKRLCGPEDYGPAAVSVDEQGWPVISRTRRPSWPKFDKRNGALIAVGTQPYTEFEVQDRDEDTMTSEEAVDYQAGQTTQDEDGHINRVMLADRKSLRFLAGLTYAEKCEASRCAQVVDALGRDRAVFDQALANAITNQRELVERIGLDQDEAEVLAVIALLWFVGPRMYLNFLDEANKRRIRNAWDRFDRKSKKPEWATLFRQALRKSAKETREVWAQKYWAAYDRSMDRQGWEDTILPNDDYGDTLLEEAVAAGWRSAEPPSFHCTCGAADHRFCTCRGVSGPIGGSWASSAGGSMRPDPGNCDGVVRLDCDLPPEAKRIYSAYEKKRNLRNAGISRKL
jgi:hypothetical protein